MRSAAEIAAAATDPARYPRTRRARTVPLMAADPVMTDEDDGQLMLRYAAGELRAFEALYARHRAGLYRYLARHTRDPEIANDLFQEVWSRVIAHRRSYEPRAKFRTFLFRIAHNCCIDHHRRARVRPQSPADPSALESSEALRAPEAERPDTRAEHAQLMERYREVLAALPAAQRDAFLLYEQSGLTLEEVATITGVGTETAKSRLRYALAKLRSALAPQAVAKGAACALCAEEPPT
jgi:RNA polymerase sigma-70 factor, ECF subfamily